MPPPRLRLPLLRSPPHLLLLARSGRYASTSAAISSGVSVGTGASGLSPRRQCLPGVSAPQHTSTAAPHNLTSAPAAAFGTAPRCVLDARPQGRYGTANEPLPGRYSQGEGEEEGDAEVEAQAAKELKQEREREKELKEEMDKKEAQREDASAVAAAAAAAASAAGNAGAEAGNAGMGGAGGAAVEADGPPKASPTIFELEGGTNGASAEMRQRAKLQRLQQSESNPLEEVLRMPAPTGRPPHLTTPPYVHHFDTWSLVKQLEGSGFSARQSVSVMKAIRGILGDNLDVARDGLVGKSDVENETYLFRAACSELQTEVENNRKAENERMSTQRNQLQHEVDILTQRLDQDCSNMKEELKGMFDDRKMTVRMEQRAMESKIQELNYKITVALNSDARSEVEGLRWTITRRAVTAIVIVAASILSTLNYSSYMTRTQEQERKKMSEALQEGGLAGLADAHASTVGQVHSSSSGAGKGSSSVVGSGGMSGGVTGGGVSGYGNVEAVMKALEGEGAGDGVMVSEGGVSLG